MENVKTVSTKEMVLMGLMTALIYLSGSIIKIPTYSGFIHIGDSMIFISAIILGKKKGTVASAIGMFLVDILGGYYFWAPFTLIIKGLMAYITAVVLERTKIFKHGISYIIAFSVGGIFMVVGYFFAGIIVSGFLTEKFGIIQGMIFASKDIVGNIIQVIVGMIIALPLSQIIIKAKESVFN